jgi:anti-sigma factor RsiW
MSCESWLPEIVDRLADEIGEERAIRLEQHLAECPACAEEMQRLARVCAVDRPAEVAPSRARMEEELVRELRRRHAEPWWAALWRRRVPAYLTLGVALAAALAGAQFGPRRPAGPAARAPSGGSTRAVLTVASFATAPSDAMPGGPLGTPDSL